LTAYNLPVADCRDLDSSWDTVSIGSVSMNVFHYIASCSLMLVYQHFTCWHFLNRMCHLRCHDKRLLPFCLWQVRGNITDYTSSYFVS
jgi:hypothetical protein